jgi:acetylornithine deacetylase
MACMLSAVSRLIEERPPKRPTVVLCCVVNEEYGLGGAPHVAHLWQPGSQSLLPHAPQAVIVAEPTDLQVVVAHKGLIRWHCQTQGRAAHSSQPHLGDNAVYRMARVVTALEKYATQIVPQLGEHPRLGRPTLSVGVISGGISVNTVPDHCTIEIDRRLLPSEQPQSAFAQAQSFVAAETGHSGRVRHEAPYLINPGLSDVHNGELAHALSQAIRDGGFPGDCVGVPYGTDAPAFAQHGIPTVVFGPGSLAQAHTKDEWIAVEQLHAATDILYRFCRSSFVSGS